MIQDWSMSDEGVVVVQLCGCGYDGGIIKEVLRLDVHLVARLSLFQGNSSILMDQEVWYWSRPFPKVYLEAHLFAVSSLSIGIAPNEIGRRPLRCWNHCLDAEWTTYASESYDDELKLRQNSQSPWRTERPWQREWGPCKGVVGFSRRRPSLFWGWKGDSWQQGRSPSEYYSSLAEPFMDWQNIDFLGRR